MQQRMCVVMHEHQRPHHGAATKILARLQMSEGYLARNQLDLPHPVCRISFMHLTQSF
jgi:hypothetical protein